MSETTSTSVKLRPRVAEAVKVWDSLPANDRKYKVVAERMGITEGRAAVYVRDGLVQLGRGDETPRGNSQGSGSSSGVGVRQVSDFEQQLQNLIDRNKEIAEQLQTEISEAQEATSTFDADSYIAAEQERLEQAVKDCEARLLAWSENTDDIASKQAEAEAKRLKDRADALTEQSGQQIEKATAAAEQAEAFLATLAEQHEAEEPTLTVAGETPSGGETPDED